VVGSRSGHNLWFSRKSPSTGYSQKSCNFLATLGLSSPARPSPEGELKSRAFLDTDLSSEKRLKCDFRHDKIRAFPGARWDPFRAAETPPTGGPIGLHLRGSHRACSELLATGRRAPRSARKTCPEFSRCATSGGCRQCIHATIARGTGKEAKRAVLSSSIQPGAKSFAGRLPPRPWTTRSTQLTPSLPKTDGGARSDCNGRFSTARLQSLREEKCRQSENIVIRNLTDQ
jgi:hypothetical protein